MLNQPHDVLLLDELQFIAVETWTGNNINLILKMRHVEHIGIPLFILLIHRYKLLDLRWVKQLIRCIVLEKFDCLNVVIRRKDLLLIVV